MNATLLADNPNHLLGWSRNSGHREDAIWLLSNAFLVITMQTGFAMLEAGSVTAKNVAHIMVKNLVDVSFGGFAYWAFGYALSFGQPSTPFFGMGQFFATAPNDRVMGTFYSNYFFQFSLASASTTILSGAVAERMKLTSYMIHVVINIFIYSIPVCWTWGGSGFLRSWGYFDFGGASVIHISGGTSALTAILMLGSRKGRFSNEEAFKINSAAIALTGTFMLWWAWLSFNCGASYGISGSRWKIAAKSAVTTLNGSIGGSLTGLAMSMLLTFEKGRYYLQIDHLIPSILGGLIAVTAGCPVITPTESLLIGGIGAFIAIGSSRFLFRIRVDDPVSTVAIHLGTAFWAVIVVALIGSDNFGLLNGNVGALKGGSWKFLGVQVVGAILICIWSGCMTAISLSVLQRTVGIRVDETSEFVGADWMDHRISSEKMSLDRFTNISLIEAMSRTESTWILPSPLRESKRRNSENLSLRRRNDRRRVKFSAREEEIKEHMSVTGTHVSYDENNEVAMVHTALPIDLMNGFSDDAHASPVEFPITRLDTTD